VAKKEDGLYRKRMVGKERGHMLQKGDGMVKKEDKERKSAG
jgi:hypothetical protein